MCGGLGAGCVSNGHNWICRILISADCNLMCTEKEFGGRWGRSQGQTQAAGLGRCLTGISGQAQALLAQGRKLGAAFGSTEIFKSGVPCRKNQSYPGGTQDGSVLACG